ncbi:hypothetical protein ACHWQZ_G010214 [Mnemiopsis leidyi]
MAYRLIDPQVLLNKLLKSRTSNSAVEVINNNLSDRRLGEKTPEATRRTPLLNEGYGLLLNNSNSPFTPLGFESVAPVNSPDINFEPPPVLKGAFTETVQTRPKIMSTFRPLPKLVNLPPRPKAADPRGRRRPDIAIEQVEDAISEESLELEEECSKIVSTQTKMKMTKSSQLRKLVSDFRMRPSTAHHSRRRAAHLEDITKTQEKSSNKGGRPKGAHHRNHPMFIPGMLDETTDDDLDDFLTPSSPIELPALRIPIVSPEVLESPRYEPKLTFVPGPPPESPELDLTLSIRGTGVNQAEFVDQLRKRQEPNSYYKPFCKPSTTLAPPTKPPVRVSTQESEEERAAITEIEAILNLQPESRSSNSSGIETQPSAERPLNRPRQILLPGAVISDSEEELPCPPPKREIKIELQTFASTDRKRRTLRNRTRNAIRRIRVLARRGIQILTGCAR